MKAKVNAPKGLFKVINEGENCGVLVGKIDEPSFDVKGFIPFRKIEEEVRALSSEKYRKNENLLPTLTKKYLPEDQNNLEFVGEFYKIDEKRRPFYSIEKFQFKSYCRYYCKNHELIKKCILVHFSKDDFYILVSDGDDVKLGELILQEDYNSNFDNQTELDQYF